MPTMLVHRTAVRLKQTIFFFHIFFSLFFLLQALEEYEMIRDGDRVLVCLSGGKDSLSLLHTLHQYQFYSKSKVRHCATN